MKLPILTLFVVLSRTCSSHAFVVPPRGPLALRRYQQEQQSFHEKTAPGTKRSVVSTSMDTATLDAAQQDADGSLFHFFMRTVISYAVPMLIASWTMGSSSGFNFDYLGGGDTDSNEKDTSVSMLYNDLYGDGKDPRLAVSEGLFGLPVFRRGSKNRRLNLGIPDKEYLRITHLNSKLESYDFSVAKATKSKALAASKYRSKSFDRALHRALLGEDGDLSVFAKAQLIEAEKKLLNEGKKLVQQILMLESKLAKDAIDNQLHKLGWKENGIFPSSQPTVTTNATITGKINNNNNNNTTIAATNSSAVLGQNGTAILTSPVNTTTTSPVNTTAAATTTTTTTKPVQSTVSLKPISVPGRNVAARAMDNLLKKNAPASWMTNQPVWVSLGMAQRKLRQLELDFIEEVIRIVGAQRGVGIRTALLGDVATRGAGNLLSQLQDRPLSTILSANAPDKQQKSLFVLSFPGDTQATHLHTLREEVTAVIRNSKQGDEVVVVLESGGGTVTGYGLAAGQLVRLKEAGLPLTVAVEQVAASGGYMMASVANRIVASPFAVLGSIGVVGETPNFYDRLKREGVEFHTVTAGKYKRTLTPTKKVTEADLAKEKETMEEILTQFTSFVKENRPSLDMDVVATGEYWFGNGAVEKGLCDEIKTVDDILLDYVHQGFNVFQVNYDPPEPDPWDNMGVEYASGGGSIVQRAVRWVVGTIVKEVRSALRASDIASTDRFLAQDDTRDRVQARL